MIRRRPGLAFLPLLLTLLAAQGCVASGPAVTLDGHRFRVEIADEPHEQARGLMFREHLDEDAGMLFIFREESPRAFWMKNCRIPLDILYFDADQRLLNIHHNVPPCRSNQCPSYRSDGPARYVLELNGGTAARLRIEPGAPLSIRL